MKISASFKGSERPIRLGTQYSTYLETKCNSMQRLHLLFKNSIIDITGKNVHHGEMIIDHKGCIFLSMRFWIYRFVVFIPSHIVVSLVNANTSNGIDTLQQNQIRLNSCFSVKHNTTHRTRPIKNKDQTMVFTIRKNSYFLEQVFIVLGVQFSCIKNSSPRYRSTVSAADFLH